MLVILSVRFDFMRPRQSNSAGAHPEFSFQREHKPRSPKKISDRRRVATFT
jgi:hypothetical protein